MVDGVLHTALHTALVYIFLKWRFSTADKMASLLPILMIDTKYEIADADLPDHGGLKKIEQV